MSDDAPDISRGNSIKFLVKPTVILAGCIPAVLWIWCLYDYPESMKDQHGYNQLGHLVMASALHILMGIFLAIAARIGVMRARFAIVVLFAPVAHVAGAPFERPWCDGLFIAPSVLILSVGALELTHTRRPKDLQP